MVMTGWPTTRYRVDVALAIFAHVKKCFWNAYRHTSITISGRAKWVCGECSHKKNRQQRNSSSGWKKRYNNRMATITTSISTEVAFLFRCKERLIHQVYSVMAVPEKFIWTVFVVDPDLRCKKCRNVFYHTGCPSCGDTLIDRRETRITS